MKSILAINHDREGCKGAANQKELVYQAYTRLDLMINFDKYLLIMFLFYLINI